MQSVQKDIPCEPCARPAGHSVQRAALVVLLNLPAGQTRHVPRPATSVYLPVPPARETRNHATRERKDSGRRATARRLRGKQPSMSRMLADARTVLAGGGDRGVRGGANGAGQAGRLARGQVVATRGARRAAHAETNQPHERCQAPGRHQKRAGLRERTRRSNARGQQEANNTTHCNT